MSAWRRAVAIQPAVLACRAFAVAAALAGATLAAKAQQPPAPPPQPAIVVTGDGSVSVPPDYAQVRAGATTRAKTAREAADANTRLMTAITAALTGAGIAEKDIQTARFSVQPVYAAPISGAEQKLTGFAVSNQVTAKLHDLAKVGDILDRLLAAGATDIGNVAFLHADPSRALDAARDAAIADARRKAELYARAANIRLGAVAWIAEDGANPPPLPMLAMRAAPGAFGAPPPIAPGEDILHVRVSVGFAIAP